MEESVSPEEKNAVNEKIGEVQSAVENVADDVAVVTAADQPGDTVTDIDSKGESAGANGPKIKDHFKGKVTKLSLAGALVDIGLDIPAAIHITQIARPEGAEFTNNIHDLLTVGQEVDVWVKKVKDGRIELTMIKPYDLEWREIKKDMVVKGTVVRMEKFGVFVEIGAERPGLIHISELAHSYVRQPSDILKVGDEVEAKVLEVNRRKKQIKLSIKALQPEPEVEEAPAEKTARPVSARAQQLKEARTTNAVSAPSEEKVRPRQQKKTSKKRAELNSEGITMSFTDENPSGEAEPTAMEIAIREAMEKAKARNKNESKKKSGVSKEQDEILNRTLNNKVA